MTESNRNRQGLERLVETYTLAFRIPENINYYAPEDLEKAQRQFVRHCLQRGCIAGPPERGHVKRQKQ